MFVWAEGCPRRNRKKTAAKILFDFLNFEINNNLKTNSMSPRSMQTMDTGDPGNRGLFLREKNRALPSPRPSANLVGIWEGIGQKIKDCCHASGLFLFSACLPERKSSDHPKKTFLEKIIIRRVF